MLSQKRAHELINAYIDHISAGNDCHEVIKKLLFIGFTEEELVGEFNFSIDDVKDAASDMDEYDAD